MNKKCALFITLLLILLSLKTVVVSADTHDNTEKAVSDGYAYLLCDYQKCETEKAKLADIKSKLLNRFSGEVNASSTDTNLEHWEDDFSHNCQDFVKTIRLGGIFLIIVEILVPLIIIVRSSFNMLSVITSGSAEELKKFFQKLLVALVAAVSIFFVPVIVDIVVGLAISTKGENATSDSEICRVCIFHPFSGDCEKYLN